MPPPPKTTTSDSSGPDGLALTLLSQIGFTIIMCLSYNILLGQGGMLSLGFAVYTGFGAFCAIHALNLIGANKLGLPVSLVPIVVGYNLAHDLSLLVLEGQRTAILASDPLGRGWNVFGTAELGVNTGIFDYPDVVAVLQLALIVLAHLLGVLVAHDRSLVALQGDRIVRGQVPMLVLMIGYTCAGLLLLFSP